MNNCNQTNCVQRAIINVRSAAHALPFITKTGWKAVILACSFIVKIPQPRDSEGSLSVIELSCYLLLPA